MQLAHNTMDDPVTEPIDTPTGHYKGSRDVFPCVVTRCQDRELQLIRPGDQF